MLSRPYILLTFVIFWAFPVWGEESLSLQTALAIARQNNPEIRAARKEWEMAKAGVRAVSTWPDPELGVEYFGFRRNTLNVGTAPERWYDVSQKIPFPGKLSLRGRAARHLARRQEGLYLAAERDVLARVKEAYYNLFYAEKAVHTYEENVEVMRRFSRIAESKYAVGKASQSDALKAQVELSRMQNMAITTRQELESARARLNSLLDRAPEVPLTAREEPSPEAFDHSFADLEKIALENRPEIHAAAHHVDHMRAEVAAARADYLPDAMVQYTWRTMEGRETDSIAMLKFNVPLWFWRQRSMVRSAAFERRHADAMLRSAQNMTRYEVEEFLTHVETARRLAELYKTTILPQAEQSLKVTETAYQSDRTGFLDLLEAERALIEFQLDYYKSLSEYGINLAHLERVLGADLPTVKKSEEPSHE